jgi:hypothetical protein
MRLAQLTIAGTIILSAGGAVVGQALAPQNWSAEDATRVADLHASGERREGTRVLLFTPTGAIADGEEADLLDRLDRGIAELRTVVGAHPWQAVRVEKLTYYISADRFVSHASAQGAVFIPLARVQDGRAPFLHEAAHELLAPSTPSSKPDPERLEGIRASRPLWLTEGLADYVALTAAARAGVAEGDVFNLGGLLGTDAACRERLTFPRGDEVLPFIGSNGGPVALFTTERPQVAPIFYACGTSFTKFIVGRIGLPEAIQLMPLMLNDGVQQRIEKLTAKSINALRAEWREAIGAAR